MRWPLFLFVLLGGARILAQTPVTVSDATVLRVLPGTSLRLHVPLVIDGPAARVELGGLLQVMVPDTDALISWNQGGILPIDSTGMGGVVWNMRSDQAYSIPFVDVMGNASPVSLVPAQASMTDRIVRVWTYPTDAANQPLPTGVANSVDMIGQELSDHMVDRYWRVLSTDTLDAECTLTWTVAEDPAGGMLNMAPWSWADSLWTPQSAIGSDTTLRSLTVQLSLPNSGSGIWAVLREVPPAPPETRLYAHVVLEGPRDTGTGLMNDALRSLPDFPLVEPYSALGLMAMGGGETIDPSVLTVAGPDAVVDWILIELRAPGDPGQVMAARCGLLQRDGDVVDVDGLSPLLFISPPGSYYVAVRHRNHLGVMTLAPMILNSVPDTLDVATGTVPLFGTEATKDIGALRMLWAGDVLGNGRLKYLGSGNDRDPILVALGGTDVTGTVSGYQAADVTMDGVVRYVGSGNDRDPILANIGGTVPTAIRLQQLP